MTVQMEPVGQAVLELAVAEVKRWLRIETQADDAALHDLAASAIAHAEMLLDLLTHMRVESVTLATPPVAPVPGQCWLVPSGGTDVWSGKAGQIAAWTEGGWRFLGPIEGMRVFVSDSGLSRIYLSSGWTTENARPDGYYVNGEKVVGARQGAIAEPVGGSVIDAECRSAVNAMLSVLRAHGLITSP